MENRTKDWGVVILAGGRGSRLGGRNKDQLLFLGETLGQRIRREVKKLGIACFVSLGDYPKEEGNWEGFQVIRDLPDLTAKGTAESIGPMGGIWSCFHQTDCKGLVFLSCDLPFFRAKMVRTLLGHMEEGMDALVWQTRDGGMQPLCGAYSRSCLPALKSCILAGNYRLCGWLSETRLGLLKTGQEGLPDYWFFNVNRDRDIAALSSWRPPVLAVSGLETAGKRSLLAALAAGLRGMGLEVAVIKHHGQDFQAKASDGDLVLLEEQKDSSYPEIHLVSAETGGWPCCQPGTALAYVADGVQAGARGGRPVFPRDQIQEILGFILDYVDRKAVERGLGR